MNFLEKDLEEIIYKSDKELLQKKGLPIYGKLLRQLRIGNYGTADIVEVDRSYIDGANSIYPYLKITVYELKKDKIGISAFLQAVRYVKGIKKYIEKRGINSYSLHITLIGKDLDLNSSFCYLPDILNDYCSEFGENFLSNYTYKYGINGLEFNDELNYSLTNEGFKNE